MMRIEIFLFFSMLILNGISKHNLKKKSDLNLNERCENLLTCDSCLHFADYCGWCFSDGLCKSGNEIGPTGSSTCKFTDWETQKCKWRKCESYDNLLSCVGQKNCFWCGDSKKCFNNSQKLEIECNNKFNIDNYLKSPKLFRDQLKTNKINSDLETLSNESTTTNDSLNKFNETNPEYKKFLEKLNLWVKANSNNIQNKSKYHSIYNPSGIFSYQINQNKNNTNLNLNNLNADQNFNISDINQANLTEKARSELNEFMKRGAKDLLKSMFVFTKDSIKIKKNNFKGNKYFLLLESIAKDAWTKFLKTFNLIQKDVYKVLEIDDLSNTTNNANKIYNFTNIIQKQNKLSNLYPFKLSTEDISYFNITGGHWNKLPGTNMTMNAYVNTTVLIAQKIKLIATGDNFASVFFHNDEDSKPLSYLNLNKKFDRIDMTNFFVRKLDAGNHNFYSAYKSDFQIDNHNEGNLIMTNTLEFPYTLPNGVITNESIFDLTKYNKNNLNSFFTINELSKEFKNEPYKYTQLNLKRFNYLINYSLFSNLDKSAFFRLKVRETQTEFVYKETLTSNSVYIPVINCIKNVGGFTLISLPEGTFEVSLVGKFIFDEDQQEKLDDAIYKEDPFVNKTGNNHTLENKFNEISISNNKTNVENNFTNFKTSFNNTDNLNFNTYSNFTDGNLKKKRKNIISPRNEYITDEINFSFVELDLKNSLLKPKKKKKNETLIIQNNNDTIQNKNTTENSIIASKKKSKNQNLVNNIKSKNNSNYNKTEEEIVTDEILGEELYKNKNQMSNFLNKNTKFDSLHPLKDSGEISILQLPITSVIYTNSLKNLFYLKGNKELNEIPNMKQNFKITTEKHVLIQINIILTLANPIDLDFRLFINGKDNSDCFMTSRKDSIVNLSTVTVDKFIPGEYNIEMLYLSSQNGMVSMSDNDWDVISMNILLLDIE